MITDTEELSRRAGKSFFWASVILGLPAYYFVTGVVMFFADLVCSLDVALWVGILSGYLAICFVNYLLFRRSAGLLLSKVGQGKTGGDA